MAAVVGAGIPLLTIVSLGWAAWAGAPKVPWFLQPKQPPPPVSSLDEELPDPFGTDQANGGDDVTAGAPATRPRAAIRIGWRQHPDRDIAIRSYYFGPVADDLVGVFRAVVLIYRGVRALGDDIVASADGFDSGVPRVVIPFSIYVGLPIGLVVGLAVTAILGLVYLVVSTLGLGIAFCLSFVLRGVDSVTCLAAGIGRICLECGGRVLTCPHYLCPECGRRHEDIRPGGYGVLRRHCVCGHPMATMLLTGAAALQGICPAEDCNGYLPPRFGRTREVVIPLFGPNRSGKTRLMYMMTTGLRDRVRDMQGNVTYVGDTGERLDMIRDALAVQGNTEKTVMDRPRGLGLFIRLRRTTRLVYFFDAAGEFYTRADRIAELKYLNKARTYIFAADPLAAKAVWSQFPASMQAKLGAVRTGRGEVEKSFQATINQMHKVAERKRFRRPRSDLAFVVTKVDLLESGGVDVSSITGSPDAWVRSDQGLNMGNLARRAEHSFTEVNYFCTAAVESDGHVDASVQTLLSRVLDRGGLELKE